MCNWYNSLGNLCWATVGNRSQPLKKVYWHPIIPFEVRLRSFECPWKSELASFKLVWASFERRLSLPWLLPACTHLCATGTHWATSLVQLLVTVATVGEILLASSFPLRSFECPSKRWVGLARPCVHCVCVCAAGTHWATSFWQSLATVRHRWQQREMKWKAEKGTKARP